MKNYKIWTEEDIRMYIGTLSEKTGYKIEETVPIIINHRLKKVLGRHYFCENEDGIIYTDSFEFAKRLVDGNFTEDFVKDVITHEYCHSWADVGSKVGCGHGARFIEKCNILGCGASKSVEGDYSEAWDNFIEEEENKKIKTIAICPQCGAEYHLKELALGSEIKKHFFCNDCRKNLKPVKSLVKNEDKMSYLKSAIANILSWYNGCCNNPIMTKVKGNKIIISMKPQIECCKDEDLIKIHDLLLRLKYLKDYKAKVNEKRVYKHIFECTFADVGKINLLKM